MMVNPDKKASYEVHTPFSKERAEVVTAVGIPAERAHEVPDRVVKALAKRLEEQGKNDGGFSSLSIFDRLKLDLFQNIAHLGNEARVVAFMRKWGLDTGSSKEDFKRARSLMEEAKEGALRLEEVDTKIGVQHAIQDTNSALARASGDFLARAVAPPEVRNSLATLVTAAVLDQIGVRLFKSEYDPRNEEQLMVMSQYMGMIFNAEEGRLMIKPRVEHQRIMNTLDEDKRRDEIKNTSRNNAAELLGKCLRAPIDYTKDVINNDVLGDSGTVVRVAEALSATAERLLESGFGLTNKVVDFAKKPQIWLSSGIATGISLALTVGPGWLPLVSGITAGTGLVAWGIDKLKDITVSRERSKAVGIPRVVSEQRREKIDYVVNNRNTSGQGLVEKEGRIISADFGE